MYGKEPRKDSGYPAYIGAAVIGHSEISLFKVIRRGSTYSSPVC